MNFKASDKAAFYQQFSYLLEGGVGLRLALETLEQHLPKANQKKIAKDCLDFIKQGHSFHSALSQQKDWFEDFEISLFEVGEKSGQLIEISRQLSHFWYLHAETRHQFLKSIVYPFFLIHFSFLVSAFIQDGGFLSFLNQFVGCLGVFYAMVMGIFLLWHFYRGPLQKFFIQWRWVRSPLLAGALYRFIFSLRLQLQAAIPIVDAMRTALEASDHPSLQSLANTVIEKLKRGESLTESLEPIFLFSPYLKSFFATGETSGKILETLSYVEKYLAQQWQQALKNFGVWLARIIYFIAMVYVIIQIFSFYNKYYSLESL